MIRASHLLFASLLLTLSGTVMATQITNVSKTIDIEPSQVSDNTFSNDVWMSDWIDIGNTIENQDKLVIDILFGDSRRIKGDDGYFNGNESIKFVIDGSAPNDFVWPYNEYRIKWWFTGIEGTTPTVGTADNPYTSLQGINIASGSDDEDISVDLVDGGSFSFSDIHLEITPTSIAQAWTINRVKVGFDADDVSVIPLPATLALFLAGLLAFAPRARYLVASQR